MKINSKIEAGGVMKYDNPPVGIMCSETLSYLNVPRIITIVLVEPSPPLVCQKDKLNRRNIVNTVVTSRSGINGVEDPILNVSELEFILVCLVSRKITRRNKIKAKITDRRDKEGRFNW